MTRRTALLLVVGISRAHATRVCENTGVHYDPPELKRGTVPFVELRDTHDHVLGNVSTATGGD